MKNTTKGSWIAMLVILVCIALSTLLLGCTCKSNPETYHSYVITYGDGCTVFTDTLYNVKSTRVIGDIPAFYFLDEKVVMYHFTNFIIAEL